jgi:hypothetical protein
MDLALLAPRITNARKFAGKKKRGNAGAISTVAGVQIPPSAPS